jgi:thiol:disulfide interchange protein DsbD
MPCVFPIISLKILSFVSLGNESKAKIRLHALSFCLGVLISFISIGIALIALKQAGNYLGWGFQLQSPVIVGMLSILMFVIGIILLTDINIGNSLTKLGGVGSDKVSGSFLTGVLAVIVASPCTAPFMGAALGYALIQPSGVTMPIFASLGLGFAAPYLVLSLSPGLINKLPKPGQWMVTLKEFFAFPMFGTSLWLIWVFGLQTNTDLMIGLLISLLIISVLFWIIIQLQSNVKKLIIWLLILGVIIYEGQQIISFDGDLSLDNSSQSKYSNYKIWSPGVEKEYQEGDQAYLINFTAAWCITCQANDKIALSRPKIKEYLKQNNIEYIVADWTNKNSDILKALESYNRNGVPLYIFWKPGMGKPSVLPAILTEQVLLDSFENDIIKELN